MMKKRLSARFICLLLAVLTIILCFAGCASEQEKSTLNSNSKLSDFSGKKVAIITGTISSVYLPKLVPDADFVEFNSTADAMVALEAGKVEAFPADESVCYAMKWEGKNVERVDEPIISSEYGMIFPKGRHLELQKEINEYIAKTKADGTHAKLESKWFADKEPTEFKGLENLTGEKGTINVGISTASKPYTYVKNGKFTGFDVEFLIGFAEEYGYMLNFEDTMFASVLAGVTNGKYDMGAAGFTITDERRENVDFTDVYHNEDIVFITKSDTVKEESLWQLQDATIGVVKNTPFVDYSKEQFPNATIEEFNNFDDTYSNLKSKNIAAIMMDKLHFNTVAHTDERLTSISVPSCFVDFGYSFSKNDVGSELQSQMNEFLRKLDDSKIDELVEKWCGEVASKDVINLDELSENERVINVAVDSSKKPYAYMIDGKPAGIEIEILYAFCKEYGYNVNIIETSADATFKKLESGECHVACGGINVTVENANNVLFSSPYLTVDVVMAKYENSAFENFIISLKESFNKTFIREGRWKLVIEGVCTTMLISLFSVLGGTILGFALYLLARSQSKWLSKMTKIFAKVYTTIIAGTPTLVILMILFYVVFTSPNMSGVIVAIAGFVLTFGAFVYEKLALTVSGVDNGQLEAAYALGYSRNKAFFRIILPQAMKMFMPSYSGEIVSLIKATSVVGYIAVNDLTKMGDIIRGNTYEAFFPLIAVALIYFAITWLCAWLLGLVMKKFEPKRRKNKNILKGIVR